MSFRTNGSSSNKSSCLFGACKGGEGDDSKEDNLVHANSEDGSSNYFLCNVHNAASDNLYHHVNDIFRDKDGCIVSVNDWDNSIGRGDEDCHHLNNLEIGVFYHEYVMVVSLLKE